MAGLFASFKQTAVATAGAATTAVNTMSDVAFMAQDGVQFARRALQNALAEQTVEQKINATSYVQRALAEAQATLGEDLAEIKRRIDAKPEIGQALTVLANDKNYQERLVSLQTELDKHVQLVLNNFEAK